VQTLIQGSSAALIAFSTMWLKDCFLPYVYPGCSQFHQLIIAKFISTIGLGIGKSCTHARMAVVATYLLYKQMCKHGT
jgi:hypothetical protein